MDGGHSETPGRAGHFDSLPRCEENPQAMWGTVVDRGPPTGGCPGGPYAGCYYCGHTSRGSPSITALPQDEGVVLEDVDYVREGRSYSQDCGSGHVSAPSNDTRMAPRTDSVLPMDTTLATTALLIDGACILHPFSVHKLDAGPVRLMTIAHAFNYRMAVLRDGMKSAVRVGRSRKTEGRSLSGLRHFLGPTSGRDISNCVHRGVRIAVFSGGVEEFAWHIAECTFGM